MLSVVDENEWLLNFYLNGLYLFSCPINISLHCLVIHQVQSEEVGERKKSEWMSVL